MNHALPLSIHALHLWRLRLRPSCYSLTFWESALTALELPEDAASAVNGNALTVITMEIYYVLAAYLLIVPIRSLTAVVSC